MTIVSTSCTDLHHVGFLLHALAPMVYPGPSQKDESVRHNSYESVSFVPSVSFLLLGGGIISLTRDILPK